MIPEERYFQAQEYIRESVKSFIDTSPISPTQIIFAVGIYAITEYGMLARTVLRSIDICSAKDIGRLVKHDTEMRKHLKHKRELKEFFTDFSQGVFDSILETTPTINKKTLNSKKHPFTTSYEIQITSIEKVFTG